MSALPLILMAAGTTMSAIGQVRAGKQQAAAEEYNARVAESQIKAVQTASASEQAKLNRQKSQMLSSQRAAYAKAGVRLDEGSPLEVMADTATEYELDLATSRYNANVQTNQLQSEANYRRQVGKQAKMSGYYGAGATLLTNFGRIGYGA